jgi:hypothetical protein
MVRSSTREYNEYFVMWLYMKLSIYQVSTLWRRTRNWEQLHAFLTPAMYGVEWWASRFGRFILTQPVEHKLQQLSTIWLENNPLFSCQVSNPVRPATACRFSDLGAPAHAMLKLGNRKLKTTVLWDVAPCILVDMHVGQYLPVVCTTHRLHRPRRQSSYSSLWELENLNFLPFLNVREQKNIG